MAKNKDTDNYDYEYSEIGIKCCAGECVWPKEYDDGHSRQATKSLAFGYEKQAGRTEIKQINNNTVEKSKMYISYDDMGTDHWLEVKYKRTAKLK